MMSAMNASAKCRNMVQCLTGRLLQRERGRGVGVGWGVEGVHDCISTQSWV